MMIGPRTDCNHLPINSHLIVKCITKYLLKNIPPADEDYKLLLLFRVGG